MIGYDESADIAETARDSSSWNSSYTATNLPGNASFYPLPAAATSAARYVR